VHQLQQLVASSDVQDYRWLAKLARSPAQHKAASSEVGHDSRGSERGGAEVPVLELASSEVGHDRPDKKTAPPASLRLLCHSTE
jgi:hypothetical protein